MGEEALVLGKRTTAVIVSVACEYRGRRHYSSDGVRVSALCILTTFRGGEPVPAGQVAIMSRVEAVHIWVICCLVRA